MFEPGDMITIAESIDQYDQLTTNSDGTFTTSGRNDIIHLRKDGFAICIASVRQTGANAGAVTMYVVTPRSVGWIWSVTTNFKGSEPDAQVERLS